VENTDIRQVVHRWQRKLEMAEMAAAKLALVLPLQRPFHQLPSVT